MFVPGEFLVGTSTSFSHILNNQLCVSQSVVIEIGIKIEYVGMRFAECTKSGVMMWEWGICTKVDCGIDCLK